MLYTIIKSKSRVKILALFLTHPDERFYYTEIFKRLKVPHALLQKELKGFVDAGLLFTNKEAGIRYYWINKDFPIYPELKGIILKTVGVADFLRDSLEVIGNIEAAFIYGSVAKNVEDVKSDIDLMVIGDVDMDKLHDAVGKAEESLGREINFTVFDPAEWRKRVQKKQSFVMDVLKNPKIYLIGDEDVVRRLS